MPIYEYQCNACGAHLEEIQKVSDEPLKTCPKCGKDSLARLISSPSLQFKGSGFYITDYKKAPSEKVETKSDTTSNTSTSDKTTPPAKKEKE